MSCCESDLQNGASSSLTIALVGNPNCGKTTLFNALTGARQHVGNWPGVTVERKTGYFKSDDKTVEVVDLPGTYSLTIVSESSSVDERIACDYILARKADVIVNIIDAANLERNLYLTLQLLEMNIPVMVAVNMMDVARQRGLNINLDVLATELGCPVVALEAHKDKGVKELKEAILQGSVSSRTSWIDRYEIRDAIYSLTSYVNNRADAASQDAWLALRLLEGDVYARSLVSQDVITQANLIQDALQQEKNEDADILIADARYSVIQDIVTRCVVKKLKQKITWTDRIDRIVLNRVLGIPIFLAVMYAMFLFAINIGGAFQDFFDIGSDALFVQGLAKGLMSLGAPNWLIALLANGVGKGVNTTLTFIPVIGGMFFFLAFLEDSGYMARAAFVVDRLMRALGLPGKSFVPMIVGFGCNVPAVMAARTLESQRDRILTVMMTPFMSCGARLAIYAVFTAAFFPKGGQNVVFVLYLIGIGMAMLTGLLLRKTVLKGDPAPLVLELPPYHVPRLMSLSLHAWQRLKGFVFRAGKLIIPICVLIGVLNAVNVDGTLNTGDADTHSLLSSVGRAVTPVFAPMGIHEDNWPATVGLVTGVLAKEVVVGTLNTLYSQSAHLSVLQNTTFSVGGGLRDAVLSVPDNLRQLGSSFGNPVLAEAPVHTLSQHVYGVMYDRFDGQMGAIAYLLFVLLYFPCVSTLAAMLREVHRGWAIFSGVWTTGVAYCVAVGFYQLATFMRHPWSSLWWTLGVSGVLIFVVMSVRTYANRFTLKGLPA